MRGARRLELRLELAGLLVRALEPPLQVLAALARRVLVRARRLQLLGQVGGGALELEDLVLEVRAPALELQVLVAELEQLLVARADLIAQVQDLLVLRVEGLAQIEELAARDAAALGGAALEIRQLLLEASDLGALPLDLRPGALRLRAGLRELGAHPLELRGVDARRRPLACPRRRRRRHRRGLGGRLGRDRCGGGSGRHGRGRRRRVLLERAQHLRRERRHRRRVGGVLPHHQGVEGALGERVDLVVHLGALGRLGRRGDGLDLLDLLERDLHRVVGEVEGRLDRLGERHQLGQRLHERVRVDRLAEVLLGAGAQLAVLLEDLFGRLARQDDDRDARRLRVLLELLADEEAVHLRQLDRQEDQVRALRRRALEARVSVVHEVDGGPPRHESLSDDPGEQRIALEEQNARCHRRSSRRAITGRSGIARIRARGRARQRSKPETHGGFGRLRRVRESGLSEREPSPPGGAAPASPDHLRSRRSAHRARPPGWCSRARGRT